MQYKGDHHPFMTHLPLRLSLAIRGSPPFPSPPDSQRQRSKVIITNMRCSFSSAVTVQQFQFHDSLNLLQARSDILKIFLNPQMTLVNNIQSDLFVAIECRFLLPGSCWAATCTSTRRPTRKHFSKRLVIRCGMLYRALSESVGGTAKVTYKTVEYGNGIEVRGPIQQWTRSIWSNSCVPVKKCVAKTQYCNDGIGYILVGTRHQWIVIVMWHISLSHPF